MKSVLPKALVGLLLTASNAFAETHTTTRADVTGISVISMTGAGGHLRRGNNPLDDPTPFTCNSGAGCLVTIQAMAGLGLSDSFVRICSTIDGVDALPNCPYELRELPVPGTAAASLQSATVSSGTHMLQTILRVKKHSKDSVLPKLRGWQIVYTIYER